MQKLYSLNNKVCACGKLHSFSSEIVVGEGVISKLPEIIKKYNCRKPFILSDKNTYAAAGKSVCEILEDRGIDFSCYTFDSDEVLPDEKSVGLAVMHYDYDCDMIIGVGSGVINDICKIISAMTEKYYVIVATAPSMDGYASSTSSMTRNGLKISLPSHRADVILGDIDILRNAPIKMLVSGIGDMLAKYVSICEWRISNLITGEYYCEEIASLVRDALKICVDNADGLLKRDKKAVKAVFEGLVISGVAMNYAGVSRPASGVEHYLSHVWDMRGIEFGTAVELHGIQCAVGTLIALKEYEKLKTVVPDRQKALKYVEDFDYSVWSEELKKFLGHGADDMIAREQMEGKYDKEKHKARLEVIINKWDDIIKVVDEELPSYDTVYNLMTSIGAPTTLDEIGQPESILPMSFKTTKDIRDKYVLSRLLWDIGVLDELV